KCWPSPALPPALKASTVRPERAEPTRTLFHRGPRRRRKMGESLYGAETLPDPPADLSVCAGTALDYGHSHSGKADVLQRSTASVDWLQLLYLEGSPFQLVAAGHRILRCRSQSERRKVFPGSGISGDGVYRRKHRRRTKGSQDQGYCLGPASDFPDRATNASDLAETHRGHCGIHDFVGGR